MEDQELKQIARRLPVDGWAQRVPGAAEVRRRAQRRAHRRYVATAAATTAVVAALAGPNMLADQARPISAPPSNTTARQPTVAPVIKMDWEPLTAEEASTALKKCASRPMPRDVAPVDAARSQALMAVRGLSTLPREPLPEGVAGEPDHWFIWLRDDANGNHRRCFLDLHTDERGLQFAGDSGSEGYFNEPYLPAPVTSEGGGDYLGHFENQSGGKVYQHWTGLAGADIATVTLDDGHQTWRARLENGVWLALLPGAPALDLSQPLTITAWDAEDHVIAETSTLDRGLHEHYRDQPCWLTPSGERLQKTQDRGPAEPPAPASCSTATPWLVL